MLKRRALSRLPPRGRPLRPQRRAVPWMTLGAAIAPRTRASQSALITLPATASPRRMEASTRAMPASAARETGAEWTEAVVETVAAWAAGTSRPTHAGWQPYRRHPGNLSPPSRTAGRDAFPRRFGVKTVPSRQRMPVTGCERATLRKLHRVCGIRMQRGTLSGIHLAARCPVMSVKSGWQETQLGGRAGSARSADARPKYRATRCTEWSEGEQVAGCNPEKKPTERVGSARSADKRSFTCGKTHRKSHPPAAWPARRMSHIRRTGQSAALGGPNQSGWQGATLIRN
jgi:hypothetical protein